jgi:hypothetical protein
MSRKCKILLLQQHVHCLNRSIQLSNFMVLWKTGWLQSLKILCQIRYHCYYSLLHYNILVNNSISHLKSLEVKEVYVTTFCPQ